jgi:hypothetical protein
MRIDMPRSRRDDLVVHGHGGLDQAGDSRRRLGMADVALDGADRHRRRVGRGLPAGLGERPQFGGIADRGARAVPL